MDLSNFHSEVERGCQYFITSNFLHIASNAGLVIAPTFRETEVQYEKDRVLRVTYDKVPMTHLTRETFYISDGELGDLIDIGIENDFSGILNDTIVFFTIRWKKAIHVWYGNPGSYQIATDCKTRLPVNKTIRLEDLFTIRKIEPPKKE